jgi:hypothetical protein
MLITQFILSDSFRVVGSQLFCFEWPFIPLWRHFRLIGRLTLHSLPINTLSETNPGHLHVVLFLSPSQEPHLQPLQHTSKWYGRFAVFSVVTLGVSLYLDSTGKTLGHSLGSVTPERQPIFYCKIMTTIICQNGCRVSSTLPIWYLCYCRDGWTITTPEYTMSCLCPRKGKHAKPHHRERKIDLAKLLTN